MSHGHTFQVRPGRAPDSAATVARPAATRWINRRLPGSIRCGSWPSGAASGPTSGIVMNSVSSSSSVDPCGMEMPATRPSAAQVAAVRSPGAGRGTRIHPARHQIDFDEPVGRRAQDPGVEGGLVLDLVHRTLGIDLVHGSVDEERRVRGVPTAQRRERWKVVGGLERDRQRGPRKQRSMPRHLGSTSGTRRLARSTGRSRCPRTRRVPPPRGLRHRPARGG